MRLVFAADDGSYLQRCRAKHWSSVSPPFPGGAEIHKTRLSLQASSLMFVSRDLILKFIFKKSLCSPKEKPMLLRHLTRIRNKARAWGLKTGLCELCVSKDIPNSL